MEIMDHVPEGFGIGYGAQAIPGYRSEGTYPIYGQRGDAVGLLGSIIVLGIAGAAVAVGWSLGRKVVKR